MNLIIKAILLSSLLMAFTLKGHARSPAVEPVLELSDKTQRPTRPENHNRGYTFSNPGRIPTSFEAPGATGTRWPELITLFLLGSLPILLRFTLLQNYRTAHAQGDFNTQLKTTLEEHDNVISLEKHKSNKNEVGSTSDDDIKKAG